MSKGKTPSAPQFQPLQPLPELRQMPNLPELLGLASLPSPPPAPSAIPDIGTQAGQISGAADIYDPQAAQRSFQITSDPQFGALAQSQLYQDIYGQLFPQAEALRTQNITGLLERLQNPMGYSPQEQTAIDAERELSRKRLTELMRTQANLGEGLYGGRTQAAEARSMGELESAFTQQDIQNRMSQNQSLQAAITQALGGVPSQPGIISPEYESSIMSPESYASSLQTGRGQDLSYANMLADYAVQEAQRQLQERGQQITERGQQRDVELNVMRSELERALGMQGAELSERQRIQNAWAQQQELAQAQAAKQNALIGSILKSVGSVAAAKFTGGASLAGLAKNTSNPYRLSGSLGSSGDLASKMGY